MEGVTFRLDTAPAAAIEAHLRASSADFVPPLASRVDLPAYAAKLHDAATTYEAWLQHDLVGLIAIYRNAATRRAFVTSVSTLASLRRSGVAREMLTQALRDLDRDGYGPVDLEVDRRSDPALRLYRSLDFTEIETTGTTVHMSRVVRAKASEALEQRGETELVDE